MALTRNVKETVQARVLADPFGRRCFAKASRQCETRGAADGRGVGRWVVSLGPGDAAGSLASLVVLDPCCVARMCCSSLAAVSRLPRHAHSKTTVVVGRSKIRLLDRFVYPRHTESVNYLMRNHGQDRCQ